MSSTHPLRLASLGQIRQNTKSLDALTSLSADGGGPSSFSQLTIISGIVSRLQWDADPADRQKVTLPCEHFDLMGGSDTGGLIVIMFVRLRMSVEEAMQELAFILEEVYKDGLTPTERTSRLKECMKSLLTKRNLPSDLKLEEEGPCESCLGFVVATHRLNVRHQVRFRTYPVPTGPPCDITIIDAALATCALQPEFLLLSYGTWYEGREYIGAGLGANNPTRQVIDEATTYFGRQMTTVLISLGSGHPGILHLGSDDNKTGLYRLMREMMADSEQEAQNIQSVLPGYFRFSVQQGMQTMYGRSRSLAWITIQTSAYISEPDTISRLNACATKLTPSVNCFDFKSPTGILRRFGQLIWFLR